jgi:fumarate hydratase class I
MPSTSPRAFFDSMVQLITRTSTDLPPDVRAAMGVALATEAPATRANQALTIIAQNIDQAAGCEGPICQDTGMPTFEVKVPVGANQIWLKQQIKDAVAEATKRGKLRPNSVDSITGENSGNNLGPGTPIIHFEQWEREAIEVKLILKGGGCENTNAQYALPADLDHLGRADRTLDGVRKCILHAVWKAQGKGCSPGAVGVCVGGDRTSGYLHAKEQLFRTLDDTNPDPRLGEIEAAVMDAANQLTVGPMGFGGKTSLIGCKIGALNRLPASFFVSVAYDCWAFRRLGVTLDAGTGAIAAWLYREGTTASVPMLTPEQLAAGFPRTGRDAVHAHLMKHEPPVDLRGAVLYHCGPVVTKDPSASTPQNTEGFKVTAAGPTTSIREEPYQADILKRYGVRVVIGKGGMGPKTLAGLQASGGVYLNAVGGAAQFYARCINRVAGVSLLEFGTPEAMWHLDVTDFPAIVTMDAHGNSLHREIEVTSGERLHTVGG